MTEVLSQDTTYHPSKNNDNNHDDASSYSNNASVILQAVIPPSPEGETSLSDETRGSVSLAHHVSLKEEDSSLPTQQPQMDLNPPSTETKASAHNQEASFYSNTNVGVAAAVFMNESRQVSMGHQELTDSLDQKTGETTKDDEPLSLTEKPPRNGDADRRTEALENQDAIMSSSDEPPIHSQNVEAEVELHADTPAGGTNTNVLEPSPSHSNPDNITLDENTEVTKIITEQEGISSKSTDTTADGVLQAESLETAGIQQSGALATTDQGGSLPLNVDEATAVVRTDLSEQQVLSTFNGENNSEPEIMDFNTQLAKGSNRTVSPEHADVPDSETENNTESGTASTDNNDVLSPEQQVLTASKPEEPPVSQGEPKAEEESGIQGDPDSSATTKHEEPEAPAANESSEQNIIATDKVVGESPSKRPDPSINHPVDEAENTTEERNAEESTNDGSVNVNVTSEAAEEMNVEFEPIPQREPEYEVLESHAPTVEAVQPTTSQQDTSESAGSSAGQYADVGERPSGDPTGEVAKKQDTEEPENGNPVNVDVTSEASEEMIAKYAPTVEGKVEDKVIDLHTPTVEAVQPTLQQDTSERSGSPEGPDVDIRESPSYNSAGELTESQDTKEPKNDSPVTVNVTSGEAAEGTSAELEPTVKEEAENKVLDSYAPTAEVVRSTTPQQQDISEGAGSPEGQDVDIGETSYNLAKEVTEEQSTTVLQNDTSINVTPGTAEGTNAELQPIVEGEVEDKTPDLHASTIEGTTYQQDTSEGAESLGGRDADIGEMSSDNSARNVTEEQSTAELKNDTSINVNVIPEATEGTNAELEPAVEGEIEGKAPDFQAQMVEAVEPAISQNNSEATFSNEQEVDSGEKSSTLIGEVVASNSFVEKQDVNVSKHDELLIDNPQGEVGTSDQPVTDSLSHDLGVAESEEGHTEETTGAKDDVLSIEVKVPLDSEDMLAASAIQPVDSESTAKEGETRGFTATRSSSEVASQNDKPVSIDAASSRESDALLLEASVNVEHPIEEQDVVMENEFIDNAPPASVVKESSPESPGVLTAAEKNQAADKGTQEESDATSVKTEVDLKLEHAELGACLAATTSQKLAEPTVSEIEAVPAQSMEETLESTGQEEGTMSAADPSLIKQGEKRIALNVPDLPNNTEHVAPLQQAAAETDSTAPVTMSGAVDTEPMDDGEIIGSNVKRVDSEPVTATEQTEAVDAFYNPTLATNATAISDPSLIEITNKVSVVQLPSNENLPSQSIGGDSPDLEESEFTTSETVVKQDDIPVDQSSTAAVPEVLAKDDILMQETPVESDIAGIEDRLQQDVNVALPLNDNVIIEPSTQVTYGEDETGRLVQTVTEVSSEESLDKVNTEAESTLKAEQDRLDELSVEESRGDIDYQERNRSLVEETSLLRDSQHVAMVVPPDVLPETIVADDNNFIYSYTTPSFTGQKQDESMVPGPGATNELRSAVEDTGDRTLSESEVDYNAATPLIIDPLKAQVQLEEPLQEQVEHSNSTSTTVVEQSVKLEERTAGENVFSGPLVAEPGAQTQDESSAFVNNEFVGVDDSTTDDQMPDSLLRRVHDRAFSGDTLESISLNNELMQVITSGGTDEEIMPKDDASAPTEQLSGSPELVPIPLGQSQSVLITPGIELRPLTPPEPDVIVISEFLNQDADIQGNNLADSPFEDTPKSIPSPVLEENLVPIVVDDSAIPEAHHKTKEYRVSEVAFDLSRGQQLTGSQGGSKDEVLADGDGIKMVSQTSELDPIPIDVTEMPKELIEMFDLKAESRSDLEKTPLLTQTAVPSESIELEATVEDPTPSAEHPSIVLETESTRSDVPEVPSSPRSELGVLTPTFDTRSEISAASHEPLAPSTPRTDLGTPSSPIVSEVGESEFGLSLAIETDDFNSEAASKASIESIPPSSPTRDLSEVSTPTKEDPAIDESPAQSENIAQSTVLIEAIPGETENLKDGQSVTISDTPDWTEDLLKQATIDKTVPRDAGILNYVPPEAAVPEVATLEDQRPNDQNGLSNESRTTAFDSHPKEEKTFEQLSIETVERTPGQATLDVQKIPDSNFVDVQEMTANDVSTIIPPTKLGEAAAAESKETLDNANPSSETIEPTADQDTTSAELKTTDEYPMVVAQPSASTQMQQTEVELYLEIPSQPAYTPQQPFPRSSDSGPNRSPQIVPLPEDDDKLHVPSPKTPRSRLISTSSSRLLPGGWKTEYAKPEGRESLELAQGEFSPPPRDESEKKKSRCNIM